MVQINIEKKHLLILVIFLSIFTIALVIAVNPTTKPNPGHLSNEVMINVGGTDKTLQAAIDDGSFGGGKTYESAWFAVSALTNYPITHNLGKLPTSILLLYSPSSDGSKAVVVDNIMYTSYLAGASINNISSTSLNIRTGNYLMWYYNEQDVASAPQTVGYYKIIVKA